MFKHSAFRKKRNLCNCSFGRRPIGALAACILYILPAAALAITPDQVLVVANKADREGTRIAEYYMNKRQVPPQNLIHIETSRQEQIDRKRYDSEIASPIRQFLLKNDPEGIRFKCLLLIYGIPLRIEAPPMTTEVQRHVLKLKSELSVLRIKLKTIHQANPEAEKKLKEEIAGIQKEISHLDRSGQGAAVDSELALVMEEKYPLNGWLPNRYFFLFRGKTSPGMPQKVIAVSRLDGPSAAIVPRVIEDSITAEREGLAGTAYFDARLPLKKEKDLSHYERYDRSIHHTARIIEKSGKLKVVLDEREALFEPGKAPDAALYCGWYSLGKYVDAFTWRRGAVGYHVASSECATLKTPSSTVWCKAMLEKGAAATLGPVAEPYVEAFPVPEVFFSCLLQGNALVDCYTVSNPFWSWQMILLGDPLYRPFKTR